MANFQYFHPSENALVNAVVTTGGTQDTAYQLANAVDFTYKNLPNPSKLTGTTGDWIFDLGSATALAKLIIWHNFDSGLAYRVQRNATNSWGAPTMDLAATAPTKRTDGRTLKAHHNLTGGSLRYLRVNVTGTNSAAIGLKAVAYTTTRTTTRNIRWGWRRDETQTGIRMMTDARFPWAYDLASSGRLLEASVPAKDADFAAISAWVQACAGFVNPTVFIPDPSVNDALLGFLTSDGGGSIIQPGIQIFRLEAPYQFTNVNPLNLYFEELTAGDPEWV